ncbi:hypothetical protein LGH70_07850 [Hymenobacter sp. BT635]|uniref:Uncharacterized protein n=1 Tax=Hymenobacter nitidus TaxID=2880929 RepID=A0ABS8AAR7_9BACT|nr:hypothetical protein [Hymenobacter nitidus]MCB2377490.1 hypothetical protein [Hymenobacter nitidus]
MTSAGPYAKTYSPSCTPAADGSPEALAQTKPCLTLTIIPTTYSTNYSVSPVISFSHTGCFHVLLTNTSEQPVNLFEEWNMWGHSALSFEIIYPNGQKTRSVRAKLIWDKNFPSTVTIAPHGFYVFNVTFNTDPKEGDVWQNSPRSKESYDHGVSCRVRAIYSIESSKQATEAKAWTGTVNSPVRSYIIWP